MPVLAAQHLLQVAGELSDVVRQGACPVAAVCGSKGTGKSSMARLLCNALLDVCPCVGFLETDCGQAEHTVPGKLGSCSPGLLTNNNACDCVYRK